MGCDSSTAVRQIYCVLPAATNSEFKCFIRLWVVKLRRRVATCIKRSIRITFIKNLKLYIAYKVTRWTREGLNSWLGTFEVMALIVEFQRKVLFLK